MRLDSIFRKASLRTVEREVGSLSDVAARHIYVPKQSWRLPAERYGIKFTHVGEDLRPDEMNSFMGAVEDMAQRYPRVHAQVNEVALLNREGTHLPEGFAGIHIPWFDRSLSEDFMPWAHTVEGNLTALDMTPIRLCQEQAAFVDPTSVIPRVAGDFYTHEFHHNIQSHLTMRALQNGPAIPARARWGQAVDRMNGIIAKHNPALESRTFGQQLELEKAIFRKHPSFSDLSPEEFENSFNERIQASPQARLFKDSQFIFDRENTRAVLGSAYAGSSPPELYAEMGTARRLRTPQYSASMENAMQEIDSIVNGQTYSSARHGARPRSRSAMGGIAYLQ